MLVLQAFTGLFMVAALAPSVDLSSVDDCLSLYWGKGLLFRLQFSLELGAIVPSATSILTTAGRESPQLPAVPSARGRDRQFLPLQGGAGTQGELRWPLHVNA